MKSWKTTLAGFAASVFEITGAPYSWRAWVSGVLLALLGLVAKDSSVTGIGSSARSLGESK